MYKCSDCMSLFEEGIVTEEIDGVEEYCPKCGSVSIPMEVDD